jgi:iron uptake system EfeUOB component EfeO/EfeM
MSKPLLAELRGALALFETVRAKQVAADGAFDVLVDRVFADFTEKEWAGFYRRNEALWKRAHERGIKRNAYPRGLLAQAIKIMERRK